jgi:hypothetical protein
VEGIWKSHDYREWRRQWTIFTLEIHRVDGTDGLRGTIRNEGWYGDLDQSEPGACEGGAEGELRFDVSMDAEGTVRDGQLEFFGVGQFRLDAVPCGDYLGKYGHRYNLDRFTGRLDPELEELQSVNNDGDAMVNAPTVFRRVACLSEARADDPARVVVAIPPAFYPPEEDAGSGCGAR